MNAELESMLLLKNKDFIEKAFERIKKLSLSEDDLLPLLCVDSANAIIKKVHRYTYPIIKEIPSDAKEQDKIKLRKHGGKGKPRYYSEVHDYQGKQYLLCNDWYYPSEGKKNIKDTRTQFLQWLEALEKRGNS
ncbi:MAG: hypothetical protein ACRCTY_09250 [Candidatus Adiutrix sp.]